MISSVLITFLFFGASFAAQQTATVVCVAGQCIQGYTNLTIGAKLSAPGAVTDILLLPGQYTSATNPELLHNVLTASGASLSPSPGFNGSSVSLPLNLALEPGIVAYASSLYGGQSSFAPLPSTPSGNSSTPVSASSLALSSNTWVSVLSGTSDRFVLWNSVPDISQLPSSISSNSLGLVDIQSAACSPPCSGNGICSVSATCTCPTGFSGSSCETCASGFFGPKCQSCPSGCGKCDDGISGSGICLVQTVTNPSSGCNCLNGVCQSNGQCSCNAGWTTASNGTACAQCQSGFFLTSDGNCQVCQLGCSQCADSSGVCITCESGFTQNANDHTECIASQTTTSSGTPCPDGSFSSGANCTPCSTSCETCSGATSNDCIICGSGTYKLNGTCVGTDGNGVCANSNLIADNNKHECDSCPSKCTSCKIPNFNVASTVNQLQCTGCLPGNVLSNGTCVESCPTGTFLSPSDNLTCTACSSSCTTCVGASSFCLTCANNQLASSGSCVSSCPSNTFSSSGTCVACHPDCETCSGGSFNQCSSCPSNRPVLTNGRCLPTCSQSQFFDTTTSTCQPCDSSCSSCAGAGSSQCLACSSSNEVLKSGACVESQCTDSTSIVPGLGACLSDLVLIPQSSGTSSGGSLPSITGLTDPVPPSRGSRLPWWEILLMALGCAFIFMVFLMCWRRRARKQRAKQTKMFAQAKELNVKDWKWKLMRFGEKLFGHPKSTWVSAKNKNVEQIGLRDVEGQHYRPETKRDGEFDNIYDAYDYSIRSPASEYSRYYRRQPHLERSATVTAKESMSSRSIYSQVTGMRNNRMPEPRQPVKKHNLMSRFSASTASLSSGGRKAERLPELQPPLQPFSSPAPASRPPTPAQEYKATIQQRDPGANSNWFVAPDYTGFSSQSRNPFLR